MRRGMLVVAMVALLAGGCELVTAPAVSGGPGCRKLVRQDAADYLNFVKLNEITYTADGPAVGRTLGDGDLGPVHARVRCSLREKMDPTGGEPEGKVRRSASTAAPTAPRPSAPTMPPTGASSGASWCPAGSASWSRPLPPDRPSGRSGRARDRPVRRSQPGAGRWHIGQVPAQQAAIRRGRRVAGVRPGGLARLAGGPPDPRPRCRDDRPRQCSPVGRGR